MSFYEELLESPSSVNEIDVVKDFLEQEGHTVQARHETNPERVVVKLLAYPDSSEPSHSRRKEFSLFPHQNIDHFKSMFQFTRARLEKRDYPPSQVITSLPKPAAAVTRKRTRGLARLWKNWPVHNIVAHPASEIFYWLRLKKLSNWIHDSTVPDHEPGTGRG